MNPPSLQDPDVTPQGTPEPEEPESSHGRSYGDGRLMLWIDMEPILMVYWWYIDANGVGFLLMVSVTVPYIAYITWILWGWCCEVSALDKSYAKRKRCLAVLARSQVIMQLGRNSCPMLRNCGHPMLLNLQIKRRSWPEKGSSWPRKGWRTPKWMREKSIRWHPTTTCRSKAGSRTAVKLTETIWDGSKFKTGPEKKREFKAGSLLLGMNHCQIFMVHFRGYPGGFLK